MTRAEMLRSCIAFGFIVGLINSALGQTEQPTCDTSTIIRPLNSAHLGQFSVRSIATRFTDEKLYIVADDGALLEKEVILPHVVLQIDASWLPQRIDSAVRAIAAGIPIDKEVITKWVGIQGSAAKVVGDLKLEKWLKMDGTKCKLKCEWYGCYPACRRTEWKTRLFSRSFEWQSLSNLQIKVGHPAGAAPAPGIPAAGRDAYDKVADANIVTTGNIDTNVPNDLERLVLDIIFWFSSALKGDFDNFNFSSSIPEFRGGEVIALDARETLYPKEKTIVYRDASTVVGREGYRGLWQIFVDTLNFNSGASGFSSEGSLVLNLVYTLDNAKFARRLGENRRLGDTGAVADPFFKRYFCASENSRLKIKEYMDELAGRLENKSPDKPFSGSKAELMKVLGPQYGTMRSVVFLEKEGWLRKSATGYEGTLPGADAIWFNRKLVLPWDTLSSHRAFFGDDKRFYSCVRRELRRLGRDIHRIKPFDYFPDCEGEPQDYGERDKVLSEVELRRTRENLRNPILTAAYTAPVSNPTYRGWYYCYRNPRMCVGKNQIMWWQRPSKYDERGGTHKGVDLIGDDFLGSTQIFAVVDGQLFFSDRDRLGWGNTLILPFEVENQTYYAVYAHLPASAKTLDGKKVKKGDSLGVSSCSGNSGDGKGSCNTYCLWSGSNRTDEHLHFEILKKGDLKNEPVDPIVFLGIQVQSDSRQFRAKCEGDTVALFQGANTSRRILNVKSRPAN